jgi:hypothetical protein
MKLFMALRSSQLKNHAIRIGFSGTYRKHLAIKFLVKQVLIQLNISMADIV